MDCSSARMGDGTRGAGETAGVADAGVDDAAAGASAGVWDFATGTVIDSAAPEPADAAAVEGASGSALTTGVLLAACWGAGTELFS